MAARRERKMTMMSDLDIFGNVPEAGAQEDSSLDIFGAQDASETGNEATETSEESTTDGGEQSETETHDEATETPAEEAKETPAEEAAEESAGTEEVDFDIEQLFEDIKDEADKDWNKELNKLVESLRDAVATKDSELMELRKQNEIIRDKLLSRAGDDAELGIYKPLIDNVESNKNLKYLATRYSSNMTDRDKERAIGILSDFIRDLTGQDISGLIEQSQADKIAAATGGGNSTTPIKSDKEDKPMNYEDSITKLF